MTPRVSLADALLRLLVACVLALPIGWERERHSRSAGLRTYPLLSLCTCGFLLFPQGVAWDVGAQSDIFYALLSGIGFVGSGAMLKRRGRGMNTAVSLWVTGAIGAGAAYGAPLVSAALTLATLLALRAPIVIANRSHSAS